MRLSVGGKLMPQTEPVIISSNDIGVTFGPVLKLTTNGTIGQAVE
jgi:hypothetical protein